MLHGDRVDLRPVREQDPGNAASRRIAEKCGFILEGTARGAIFNAGQNNDVLLHSRLRTDPRPWQA